MAENTPKRPIWVTVAAALATIVVILGIAAGPTVVGCATSADGLGLCMRERLADIGLLRPTPTEVASKDVSVQETAVAASPVEEEKPAQTAASMPADTSEVETVAPTEAPEPVAPRLGLVRAEPDGSLVIAGSADPGAEVEIYANGELLGRVTAQPSGDWVLVPDQPLPPGGVEITVRVPETGQLAEQSVVVVIQDDRTTEPLVVASTPGQASNILQGLSKPEETASEPDRMEVASAEPSQDAGTPTTSSAADTSSPAAAGAQAASQPTESAPASAASQSSAAEPSTPVPQPAPAAEQQEEIEVADTSNAAVESPAEPSPQPATASVTVPPTIDAVEVDGSRNFFAGSGTSGATVRLYVDDQFIGDATVSDGRWLIETPDNYLTKPSQRVRVDMLKPGSAEVAARAEVNFELNIPEVQPSTRVASAPETQQATDPSSAINAAAADNDSNLLSGAPQIVADSAQPTDQPSGTAAATASQPEPAATSSAAGASSMAQSTTAPPPSATAQTQTNEMAEAEPDVPTMTAVQVGDPADQRFASGKAIIRRGDNLWSIATRVYGSGYRYTTIYRANRGQIRNPDLIYPGQVFELPTQEQPQE